MKAGALRSGWVASASSFSDSSIRPRPMATRPRWRGLSDSLDRKAMTPAPISSGETQPRSNDRTWAAMVRADIGAQHDGEGDRQRDQAAAGEGGDQQRGGRARLQQAGDGDAAQEGGEAVARAGGDGAAQRRAEGARQARADHAHAPQQQRHAAQHVQDGLDAMHDRRILRLACRR